MIKINLLGQMPASVARREWLPREQRSALLGLGLLMLTALGVGGWWYYLHHTRVALDVKIGASESELVRLKDAAKLVADTTARKTELAERLSLIDELRSTKRAPVRLLETVSQSVPDGLWLLDIKQVGASAQIDGRAMSLTAVTDFAERLQNSGLFLRPVEILTTTTETLEDATLVHFSLKADVAPEPKKDIAPAGSSAAVPSPPAVPAGPSATSTNPAQPGTSAAPAVPTTAAGSVAVAPAANPVPGKAGA